VARRASSETQGADVGERVAGAGASPPARRPCYDQAAQLLGQRAHFERELGQKLSRRGYPPDEVTAAIARLRREGHLDDRRTAGEWLRVRRRRGDGPRRLVAGLVRRGLDRGSIEQLVAGDEPDAEVAGARQVAERWLARQSGRGAAAPAKLARHLDRRGFGRRAILNVLDELQLPAQELTLDG
jgi:regulatory protein